MSETNPPRKSARPLYTTRNYSVDESIGHMVRQVRAAIVGAVEREFSGHDVSHDQWGVLLVMAKGQGATAAELARIGECDTGSMTRMIDRLEAKGLLKRRRCNEDRRVVWLELTPTGHELAEKLLAVVVKVQNKFLKGFSADDLAQFKDFFRRMLANRDQD